MIRSLLICISSLLLNFGYSKTNLHPDEGELLCFEFTTVDCGKMYSYDDTIVAFPFKNCSGHDLSYKQITCNNAYQEQVFSPYFFQRDSIILDGEMDTLFFKKKKFYRTRAELLDVSFTVSFHEFPIRQHLNIFVDFVANYGNLEVSEVKLPTVERGDTVKFKAMVVNKGESPVTLKATDTWARHYEKQIIVLSKNPIVIPANGSKEIEFMLFTDRLLVEYSDRYWFESNEDNRDYQRVLIPYAGKLISHGFPSIKFDTLVQTKHITQREACNFEFWFENNGDEPLIISQCKTSCGCLVASWPQEPILPGERNVIKIKYDSNRIGPINKSCTVQTNASEKPIVLRVKGNVKPLNPTPISR